MLEAGLWHPVAASTDVAAAPVAVRLLERELVLWREPAAGVQAWADRCPHRGTRLSIGRVADGRLECAYHGWQFGAGGACRAVPALPGFTPGPAHAAHAYEANEAHGRRLGAPGEIRRTVAGDRWRAAAPDRERAARRGDERPARGRELPGHVAFPVRARGAPRRSRSRRGAALRGDESPCDGRPVAPTYRAWQPQGRAGAAGGAWVDYRYEVLGPYAAVLFKRADAGEAPQEAYALWISPGRARIEPRVVHALHRRRAHAGSRSCARSRTRSSSRTGR